MIERLLIRLRWPTTFLAVLVLATMVATYWWDFSVGHTVKPGKAFAIVVVANGNISVMVSDGGWTIDPYLKREAAGPKPLTPLVFRSQANPNSMYVLYFFPQHVVPLWAVALPLAILTFVGFWMKRRTAVAGCCKKCLYPLHGESICPECGAT